jgi:hypothetical protein
MPVKTGKAAKVSPKLKSIKRRQKGAGVYTQEYIDNDENYVEFEGEKYLLDIDTPRNTENVYKETDFATDAITSDKIKKR